MTNFMKRNGKWQARVSWRDANGIPHVCGGDLPCGALAPLISRYSSCMWG